MNAIPMNEYERWRANASLRQGELIADLVLRLVADLGAVVHALEHGIASVAHAIKVMLAKPVKH